MIAATRLIDKSMGIDLLPCQHKIIIKKKKLEHFLSKQND